MVVEAGVAIGAGIAARSITLLAFGIDGVIELASAGMLIWRILIFCGIFVLAVIVCIVVIAARELHKHTGLVAYRPCIMTGRQQHDVVLREILLRTIVHNDPERSRKDECHVRQLTAVRSCKFLQIA